MLLEFMYGFLIMKYCFLSIGLYCGVMVNVFNKIKI